MRKLKIAALVIFCSGILLTGIGIGISMIEYTSLEYSGSHILDEDQRQTITENMPIKLEEGQKILIRSYDETPEILYDENMTDQEIQFELTYNQELMDVYIVNLTSSIEDYGQELMIIHDYAPGKDFDIWMKHKDQILAELREGKLGSWYLDWDTDVKITIPSSLKDFVEIAE